jgi:hypothetical protein
MLETRKAAQWDSQRVVK